jgi:hypothetical protein
MPASRVDDLSWIRERIAEEDAGLGFHPCYRNLPVRPDEPLWAISFQATPESDWTRPNYNTATCDLNQAVEEARTFVGATKRARVSVHATIPRCETYTLAKGTLLAMLVAVPDDRPHTVAMRVQIADAFRVVLEAEKESCDIDGLRVDLPIALDVEECGQTRSIKTITWGNHGGWPEWHRCTVPQSA